MGARQLLSAICAIILSGCSALDVLTFQADEELSGKVRPSTVSLRAFSRSPLVASLGELPEPVRQTCSSDVAFLADPSGVLLVGATTVALNLLSRRVGEYAEEQKKRFEKTYPAKANLRTFTLGPDPNQQNIIRCIYLKRTFGRNNEPALDFVFEPVRVGQLGYAFRPLYLNVPRAMALTAADPEGAAIDVSFQIGVSTVGRDGNGNPVSSACVQNMNFKAVRLGKPLAENDLGRSHDTGVCPMPGTAAPATLAVVTTEKGSGADTFGSFLEDHKKNADVMIGIIGQYITTNRKVD